MNYRQLIRIHENRPKNSNRLLEWMTIADLNNPDASSDFTKHKRAIRTALYKGENITARITSKIIPIIFKTVKNPANI